MSATSGRHHKLTNGVGACSKPMWSGFGAPAGFCDEPAFGKQVRTHRPDGTLMLCSGLACPAHGGPEHPTLDIVFDGPPDHEAPRFVECENALGQSVSVGEWIKRKDGYHVLRIPYPDGDSR